MDQLRNPSQSNSVSRSSGHTPLNRFPNSSPEPRQQTEVEVKDASATRKVQKADREKLRRDRLNEQFFELGNTLDPERPKNDKATILVDTIQLLKDLTSEVNRLKAECAALSEESRELIQEKNELKEEKASLKSDIDNLSLQYQQRVGFMVPWPSMDASVVMAPPYSYPVPLPVPPRPIPMHPTIQPFPFPGHYNPGATPNPYSTFIPYIGHANSHFEQPSNQYTSSSRVSSAQDSRSKSSDRHRDSNDEKSDESDGIVTELELKTPGSAAQQGFASGDKKGKHAGKKNKSITDGSSSSRHSSSQGFEDSASNNNSNILKSKK